MPQPRFAGRSAPRAWRIRSLRLRLPAFESDGLTRFLTVTGETPRVSAISLVEWLSTGSGHTHR